MEKSQENLYIDDWDPNQCTILINNKNFIYQIQQRYKYYLGCKKV